VDELCAAGVGVVFAYLGNYMPKIKRNFFVGLKTPWMIIDQEASMMSQWVGGRMMFWLGMLVCVLSLLIPHMTSYIIIMVGVILLIFTPSLVSFFWYRKIHKKPKN